MSTTSEYGPHRLGQEGEALAVHVLERRGWRILARNYRAGRREIDVVATRGDVLAFVEVKTRSGPGFGRPEAAVTLLKRREIEAVALDFLTRHVRRDLQVRFDVVAVTLDPAGRSRTVEHIEDAWRPGWS